MNSWNVKRSTWALKVTDVTLTMELSKGRSVSAPPVWHPRLLHATPWERDNWRLRGGGSGVHWPDFGEDISVANLRRGQLSGESRQSLKRGLARRSVTAA